MNPAFFLLGPPSLLFDGLPYPTHTNCRRLRTYVRTYARSITWQPNEKWLTIFYEYGVLFLYGSPAINGVLVYACCHWKFNIYSEWRSTYSEQRVLLYSQTFTQLNRDCHCLIVGHVALTEIKCIPIVIDQVMYPLGLHYKTRLKHGRKWCDRRREKHCQLSFSWMNTTTWPQTRILNLKSNDFSSHPRRETAASGGKRFR